VKDVDGVAICDFDDFSLVALRVAYIRTSNIEEGECTDEEYVEEGFSNRMKT